MGAKGIENSTKQACKDAESTSCQDHHPCFVELLLTAINARLECGKALCTRMLAVWKPECMSVNDRKFLKYENIMDKKFLYLIWYQVT